MQDVDFFDAEMTINQLAISKTGLDPVILIDEVENGRVKMVKLFLTVSKKRCQLLTPDQTAINKFGKTK